MGAKASIAAVVPATTHTSAAQTLGRNPALQITQAQTQITDAVNALKVIGSDMTKGNASDPNIATINAIITSLS